VLKLLAGGFLAAHGGYRDAVALLLLDHILVQPATRKLALTAVRLASRVGHPVFQGTWWGLLRCGDPLWSYEGLCVPLRTSRCPGTCAGLQVMHGRGRTTPGLRH
jgi:hypothetical protein